MPMLGITCKRLRIGPYALAHPVEHAFGHRAGVFA
jgi:hypothetical protein